VKALIFDCDGVIVDTERDGHRVAFNRAFAALGLGNRWGVEEYGRLLAVAGGKERLRAYFTEAGWPETAADKAAFIQELHNRKTAFFLDLIEEGNLPLRSGVARLVDEAVAAGLLLAICSTSNERAVQLIARRMLEEKRRERFLLLAGDIVPRKKPDPAIYALAGERLGVAPEECVVVEDSRNGLIAARAAGMRCVITRSCYTQGENFREADAVYQELGDPPGAHVRLSDLLRLRPQAP